MKSAALLAVGLASAIAAPAYGETGKPHGDHDAIRVTPLSQQFGPARAGIAARIDVNSSLPGRSGGQATTGAPQQPADHPAVAAPAVAAQPNEATYPSLPSDSSLLENPTPAGPGSFWYPDGSGHTCIYAPSSVLPCFNVTAAAAPGAPPVPALDPAAVAASVADRLPLSPGRLRFSPSAQGLTGAASWFWLDPAPTATTLSVALAGVRVTVTAEPAKVDWRFGDGAAFSGGSGVPYQPGPPPSEAVTHVYPTRCLPGDQGRDPYVLDSCGGAGYPVAAVVRWRITYRAVGRVRSAGSLPTRSTEADADYAVTEARAFLVGGGAR
jgi:hypothetical protein